MIGFHAEDANLVDMVQNANCVVACLRSLISQDQPPGGELRVGGDALFGLFLILDGVNNTLEAATLKM